MPTWPKSAPPFEHRAALLVGAALLLLLSMACGVLLGSRWILGDLLNILRFGEQREGALRVLLLVRLPRVLAAALSGGALAASGTLTQVVLGNPLAGPNVIGVNAGAGFFVLLAAALWPGNAALPPLGAFGGAMLAALAVLGISRAGGGSGLTVVLSGVAISGMFSAGMNLILLLCPDAYVGSGTFLAGGLSGVTLGQLRLPGAAIGAGLAGAVLCSHRMNILALGPDQARALGMRVGLHQFLLLLLASLLAGSAVGFAGLIGFVGLIAPQMARLLIGHDNRFALPLAALLGAVLVVLCDLASRVLFDPYELPVGILLSLLGGPFFLLLILGRRRASDD